MHCAPLGCPDTLLAIAAYNHCAAVRALLRCAAALMACHLRQSPPPLVGTARLLVTIDQVRHQHYVLCFQRLICSV